MAPVGLTAVATECSRATAQVTQERIMAAHPKRKMHLFRSTCKWWLITSFVNCNPSVLDLGAIAPYVLVVQLLTLRGFLAVCAPSFWSPHSFWPAPASLQRKAQLAH